MNAFYLALIGIFLFRLSSASTVLGLDLTFATVAYISGPLDRSFTNASVSHWKAEGLPCTLEEIPLPSPNRLNPSSALLVEGAPRCFPDDLGHLLLGTYDLILWGSSYPDKSGNFGFEAKVLRRSKNSPVPIYETDLLLSEIENFDELSIQVSPTRNAFEDMNFVVPYVLLGVGNVLCASYKVVYCLMLIRSHWTAFKKRTPSIEVALTELLGGLFTLAIAYDYQGALGVLLGRFQYPVLTLVAWLALLSTLILGFAFGDSLAEFEDEVFWGKGKKAFLVFVVVFSFLFNANMGIFRITRVAIIPVSSNALANLLMLVFQVVVGVDMYRSRSLAAGILVDTKTNVDTESKVRIERMVRFMYLSAFAVLLYVFGLLLTVMCLVSGLVKLAVLSVGISLSGTNLSGLLQVCSFPRSIPKQ